MKRFIVVLVILMCVVMTGCQPNIKEETEVAAVVTELEYEESYISYIHTYNSTTKTTILTPFIHPEKYIVTVTFEGITGTIDNQTLYETVKEGDVVQVILCKEYNRDGELISATFKLPE